MSDHAVRTHVNTILPLNSCLAMSSDGLLFISSFACVGGGVGGGGLKSG